MSNGTLGSTGSGEARRFAGVTLAWIVGVPLALALCGVLIWGLVLGGFAIDTANQKHQGQIINIQTHNIEKGQGYQQAKTDDLNAQIANVLNTTTAMTGTTGSQFDALHAQRLGDARLACADAAQITAIPAAQAAWVHANCEAGTLNPASPLFGNH
jgi:hypothetical protein